jgi:hypothetical protein
MREVAASRAHVHRGGPIRGRPSLRVPERLRAFQEEPGLPRARQEHAPSVLRAGPNKDEGGLWRGCGDFHDVDALTCRACVAGQTSAAA